MTILNVVRTAATIVTISTAAAAQDEAEFGGYDNFYVGLGNTYNYSLVETESLLGGVSLPFALEDHGQLSGGATIFAGKNWQRGKYTFGIEAGISNGSDSREILDTLDEDEFVDYNVQWTADLAARVGFVSASNYHFYGRVGYVLQNTQYGYINFTDDLASVENDDRAFEDLSGWSVGAGIEKAITANTLGRLEVKYVEMQAFEEVAINSNPSFDTWSYDPSSLSITAALVINF